LVVIKDERSNPRVLLFDRSGHLERTNELTVPDAVRIHIGDAAVSPQGVVAVQEGAARSDGTWVSMIVIFNKPGAPSLIIRTNPYGAGRLAFSPDGSLWALVWNREAEDRGEDYGIFRKYMPDGRIAGQFVMRSTFPIRGNPATDGLGPRGGFSYLRATRNAVGAYLPLVGEWIELDNSGKLLGRWQTKAPSSAADSYVAVVGFTASGSVYAQLEADGAKRVLCRLDKSSGFWEPIGGSEYQVGRFSPIPPFFYGADGNQLVFGGAERGLVWFDEPR
jgi:hypothetical protein